MLQLNESADVTLDASGNGEVKLGPRNVRQVWNVTNAAVSVSSSTLEPTARLYLGPATAGALLGGSYSGSQDSTDLNVILRSGNVLTVVWEGGDVGATATLSIYGTYTVR